MRQFKFTVENGLGDQGDVKVDIPDDVNPMQRSGIAIFRARRVLPDVKPWRVIAAVEDRPLVLDEFSEGKEEGIVQRGGSVWKFRVINS